ncbi:MAG: nuclear transport factor 2 family protein [Cyclobacteriaceae bacterium]
MTMNVSKAQTEKEEVKNVITQFVQAADQQDAEQVASILHEDFRVVMNQLFGSNEVSTMSKSVYVQLIRDKKMGGEKRTIDFVSVDVVNQNASVKVLLKGKTMVFESLLHLIKTTDGKWQLINDLPFATKI